MAILEDYIHTKHTLYKHWHFEHDKKKNTDNITIKVMAKNDGLSLDSS